MFRRSSRALQTSFANNIFRGKIVPNEVFPYPSAPLSEEATDALQTLQTDLKSKLGGKATGSSGSASSDSLKESGLFGIGIADEFGGLGLPPVARTAAAEAAAAIAADSTLFVRAALDHSSKVLSVIDSAASDQQKGRLLPDMSDGKTIVGWAAEELSGGVLPDISRTAAKATYDAASETFTLSGEKVVASGDVAAAGAATVFLVLAKAPTQTAAEPGATGATDAAAAPVMAERLTWFLVDKAAAGVHLDGAQLKLDKVKVGAGDLIGAAGKGFMHYSNAVLSTQHLVCAGALGAAKRLIATAKPTAMDANPDAYALARANLYALESTLYLVASNVGTAGDVMLEMIAASVVAKRLVDSILEHRLLLFSSDDSAQTEALLDGLRTHAFALHDVDTLQQMAACVGLEDFSGWFNSCSTLDLMQQRTVRAVGVIDKLPPCSVGKELATKLEGLVVEFANAAERSVVKNGPSVRSRQLILQRLSTVDALLFSCAATLSRVQAAKDSTKNAEIAATQLWHHVAQSEVSRLCWELMNIGRCPDEAYGRLAATVLDRFAGEAKESLEGAKRGGDAPLSPSSSERTAKEA